MRGLVLFSFVFIVFGKYDECPGKCNGHGTCLPRNVNHPPNVPDYICRCEAGYTGQDCEESILNNTIYLM